MESPAESVTNQGSGSGSKKVEALDDMLHRLGIEDDEIDDLILEE
jgi:SOS response regulatory protein OraA/RecX